ncbi:hypothetical protein Mtc_0101 [Methanocella conradii HZ254]|uniref:HEAT repeat domain-containing protein n=1 Tax=Methanocella conradii (strain DSM 24694 / JCM 17849 / CGMCC 1.5162 / HZ254) TaxID=1041930 RepID=H8I6I2_METCZ|nr:HEAT repeat domain-containing protein [Methanocella conradii]AFC98874.1 hypothetical protein Mtc_0101 [Methanocella conradii HZ254]
MQADISQIIISPIKRLILWLSKRNIAKLEKEEDVGGLAEILCGMSGELRLDAALALGRIGGKSAMAMDSLIYALRDNERDARRCAAIALGEAGCYKAVTPLIMRLRTMTMESAKPP